MQGNCFIFSDQGGGSDFCFFDDKANGYFSTFSIQDFNLLEIFDLHDGNLLWAGNPKGKNRIAMMKCNCIGQIPEEFPTERLQEWLKWFSEGYPAILTGAGKSWGQK